MAHDVCFSIPERALGRADVDFMVRGDGSTIGCLKISKGSVVWFPKDHSIGYKLSWQHFDKVMREQGWKCERR